MDKKKGNVERISGMMHIIIQNQKCTQNSTQQSVFETAWSKSGQDTRKNDQKLNRKERKDRVRDLRMRNSNLIQEEANREKVIDITSWREKQVPLGMG